MRPRPRPRSWPKYAIIVAGSSGLCLLLYRLLAGEWTIAAAVVGVAFAVPAVYSEMRRDRSGDEFDD